MGMGNFARSTSEPWTTTSRHGAASGATTSVSPFSFSSRDTSRLSSMLDFRSPMPMPSAQNCRLTHGL